jgi:hypothetical protein
VALAREALQFVPAKARDCPMNEAKPNTAMANDLEKMIGEWQRLADALADKCPQISDAALAFITAINYHDETLVDSSLASLRSALAEFANTCIARELKASSEMQAGVKDGWQKYVDDKKAFELAVFECVKDTIESIIDERVTAMMKARKLVRRLKDIGQHVETSRSLEDGIRQLRTFREEFFRRWPSQRPPSPINRDAIAKARESFQNGHRGLSKDQMIWRDKRSEKPV